MKKSLKEIQRYCLEQNITFVSYLIPGEKSPISLFLPSDCELEYAKVTDVNLEDGFLMAPFQSDEQAVLVIPDKIKFEGWEIDEEDIFPFVSKESRNQTIGNTKQYIADYHEYTDQISQVKEYFTSGKAKKVVLSRIKPVQNVELLKLPDIFEKLIEQYPEAFVYVMNTPDSGAWIGATPETLLQVDNNNYSTMALAGTRSFADYEQNHQWSEKDIKEQEFVASYVRQKLSSGGYRYSETKTSSVQAGNVVHLQTVFQGSFDHEKDDWKKLVKLLYPTPAICGTDDEGALQVIKEVEKHNREYYTGFIGPFSKFGNTDLFINLRCMKVVGNSALLYAGGGILNESSALQEWNETELKFNTLEQVIDKVNLKLEKAG